MQNMSLFEIIVITSLVHKDTKTGIVSGYLNIEMKRVSTLEKYIKLE